MTGRREREASLAMVGPRPARTADRIAALRSLAGLRLEPLPDRVLRDVYLDRPDDALRAAGLALRLRESGEDPAMLALKGDARPLPGGGVDRLEAEASWGGQALGEVGELLEEAGVPGATLPEGTAQDEPVEQLRSAGWKVVQERTTRRRSRRLRPGPADEAAGELAVDEVRFRPGGRQVLHREVEVEARADDRLPGRALEALRDRFGDAVRPWDHSKLATGEALERLLAGEDPDRWLRPDGGLAAAAYDRLDELLAGI